MSFATLGLIAVVAVLGPVLALPRGWQLPVVLGELVGGIALGPTGFGVLHAYNETFAFSGGGRVRVGDVRRRFARAGAGRPAAGGPADGVLRAVGVGVLSAGLGVLLASSSAALILPMVGSLQPGW